MVAGDGSSMAHHGPAGRFRQGINTQMAVVGLLGDPEDARHPGDIAAGQAAVGMAVVERAELGATAAVPQQLLGHDLAVAGLDDDAVAAADRRSRRDDDDVAGPVGRLHAVAGDLEGVDAVFGDARQLDLVPAAAGGISCFVEMAGDTGPGIAEQRDAASRRPSTVADQPDEGGKRLPGRLENLGDAFGTRLASLAARRNALALVEGRRVELRFARQPRRCEIVLLGEKVDPPPDVLVSQHAASLTTNGRFVSNKTVAAPSRRVVGATGLRMRGEYSSGPQE